MGKHDPDALVTGSRQLAPALTLLILMIANPAVSDITQFWGLM
jgi:hypothetical protein